MRPLYLSLHTDAFDIVRLGYRQTALRQLEALFYQPNSIIFSKHRQPASILQKCSGGQPGIRKNSNAANVPDRSSSKKPAGSDSQDSQTNAASGGQDGETDADENNASYDNDGQTPDSVLDTEGSPSSYPEYDAEKSARHPNTDEQTRYPSASDPDDIFYYSDTDNQMRFSANTGSSLPSIPDQLPVERLVDTMTDDADIPHYIQFSSEWNLILVNSWNKLPDNYEVRLTSLANGHFIDSRCYPALTQMMADCRSAGLDPLICSSYRSMQKQRSYFRSALTSWLHKAIPKRTHAQKLPHPSPVQVPASTRQVWRSTS